TAHGEWRVYPGGANDWLVKRAPASLAPIDGGSDAVPAPPDIDAAVGPLKGIPTAIGPAAIDASRGAAKAAPGDNRQVDVMIIYTKDLAEKLGTGLMPML